MSSELKQLEEMEYYPDDFPGDWLEPNEYAENDNCTICNKEFGRTKAVYRTSCFHVFHNDCLLEHCENPTQQLECPMCKTHWDPTNEGWCGDCNNVDDFKNDMFEPSAFGPHVMAIYQKQHKQGGKTPQSEDPAQKQEK